MPGNCEQPYLIFCHSDSHGVLALEIACTFAKYCACESQFSACAVCSGTPRFAATADEIEHIIWCGLLFS